MQTNSLIFVGNAILCEYNFVLYFVLYRLKRMDIHNIIHFS